MAPPPPRESGREAVAAIEAAPRGARASRASGGSLRPRTVGRLPRRAKPATRARRARRPTSERAAADGHSRVGATSSRKRTHAWTSRSSAPSRPYLPQPGPRLLRRRAARRSKRLGPESTERLRCREPTLAASRRRRAPRRRRRRDTKSCLGQDICWRERRAAPTALRHAVRVRLPGGREPGEELVDGGLRVRRARHGARYEDAFGAEREGSPDILAVVYTRPA